MWDAIEDLMSSLFPWIVAYMYWIDKVDMKTVILCILLWQSVIIGIIIRKSKGGVK